MKEFDTTLMLEPVLANVIKSLADFFGTTTEAVMNNAPQFLAEYGWYYALSNLPYIVLIIVIVGLGGAAIVSGFFDGKWAVIMFIFVFIVLSILIAACGFLPVLISPEMYGLDHLIYAITGKNVI